MAKVFNGCPKSSTLLVTGNSHLKGYPQIIHPDLKVYFKIFSSGQRDSNARHSPWQGDALPLSYARKLFFYTSISVPNLRAFVK